MRNFLPGRYSIRTSILSSSRINNLNIFIVIHFLIRFEIVSNWRSGLDVDRFDYFARDAFHLGLPSSFDQWRYIENLRLDFYYSLDFHGNIGSSDQTPISSSEQFSTEGSFPSFPSNIKDVPDNMTAEISAELSSELIRDDSVEESKPNHNYNDDTTTTTQIIKSIDDPDNRGQTCLWTLGILKKDAENLKRNFFQQRKDLHRVAYQHKTVKKLEEHMLAILQDLATLPEATVMNSNGESVSLIEAANLENFDPIAYSQLTDGFVISLLTSGWTQNKQLLSVFFDFVFRC